MLYQIKYFIVIKCRVQWLEGWSTSLSVDEVLVRFRMHLQFYLAPF